MFFLDCHAPAPGAARPARVRAGKLAGLKGFVTSLTATVMSPAEVISRYHDLWQILDDDKNGRDLRH